MMAHVSKPPMLLTDVVDDPRDGIDLLGANAPYTPLGGWYNPGADPVARTRPLWFQNDWVHDGWSAEGAELFLTHPAYLAGARSFYDAEIVEPHSVYVNHMMAMPKAGPAHTDNPRFAVGTGPTRRCGSFARCSVRSLRRRGRPAGDGHLLAQRRRRWCFPLLARRP